MFLIRKHIIIILISFELLLLSININFISASIFIDDLQGQIISLLVLTVAASESALGLALLIVYYRLRGGISLDLINLLKS
jgi:NADH-quinone oxidoreductase subunit K